jgi:hypothetical protein
VHSPLRLHWSGCSLSRQRNSKDRPAPILGFARAAANLPVVPMDDLSRDPKS